MARYYDFEARAATMDSGEGEELLKRWIQSLDRVTGPVRRQAVEEVIGEALERQREYPWQWTDHKTETEMWREGWQEDFLQERREALGTDRVWGGYEGYDGEVPGWVEATIWKGGLGLRDASEKSCF